MKPWAYYNEIEPAAAHVMRALISANVIAPGEVDERSLPKGGKAPRNDHLVERHRFVERLK